MRLLVTGGDGQVGRSLAWAAPSDWQVMPIGRHGLDITRADQCAASIAALAPDCIVNAAAFTAVDAAEADPAGAFGANREGAQVLATAAAKARVRLIHLSTDYVFDGHRTGPGDEAAATAPVNVYGASKLAGERAVRAACPQATIVRTAWLFGPFGRNFLTTMIDLARTQATVRVIGDQSGSPTSSLFLARALLDLAGAGSRGVGRTYHVAGADAVSWAELARAIFNAAGRAGLPAAQIDPITSDQWPAAATRPGHSVLSSDRIRRDLGIVSPPLATAIDEVIDVLKRQKAGALVRPGLSS